MIVTPAVDLREGACVQLVGGEYANERIRLEDPLAVAQEWAELGFAQLHVVDLDAATGRGSNKHVIDRILATGNARVTVGGGVGSTERITELRDAGAERVVIGSRALEDRGWLAEVTAAFPAQLIVAVDVKVRTVVSHGWTRGTGLGFSDTLAQLANLPLAGVLITAVHCEGRLAGSDIQLFMEAQTKLTHPLVASGGVSSMKDLSALEKIGASEVVVGMAFYSGALQAGLVAKEFGR